MGLDGFFQLLMHSQDSIIKIACFIFFILFAINWMCIVSTLKFKKFRYGDFIVVFMISAFIIHNAQNIRTIPGLIPDLISIATLEIKEQCDVAKVKFIGSTRGEKDMNAFKSFMIRKAEDELAKQMMYFPPGTEE